MISELSKQVEAIKRDQRAFEEQLDKLINDGHGGEFVLFKDGQIEGFFKTEGDAYAAGLKRHGPDDVFLVDQVIRRPAEMASLSWDLGLLHVPE